MLAGKRQISAQKFQQFANRLGLPPDEVARFQVPARLRRKRPPGGAEEYRDLSVDEFEAISDWQHFAILELTQLQKFKPSAKWIAGALKISVPEVSATVDRLVRVGFLDVTDEGKWIDRSGAVSVYKGAFTSAAQRKLQRQVLEQSLRALEEVPIQRRDHSSMTMAIDSSKLPEARERIKKFRREMCEFLKDGRPKRDQVAHLAISLFPLTD